MLDVYKSYIDFTNSKKYWAICERKFDIVINHNVFDGYFSEVFISIIKLTTWIKVSKRNWRKILQLKLFNQQKQLLKAVLLFYYKFDEAIKSLKERYCSDAAISLNNSTGAFTSEVRTFTFPGLL